VTDHDPKNCQDGAGCKPCKVEEAKAQLRQLASTKKIRAEDRARALAGLRERVKGLLGDGGQAALALLLVCLTLAGCVAPEAIEQARVEAAALHGVAVNPGNHPQVRAVAARGSLAWCRQHEALTGDPVPGAETWAPIDPAFLPAEPR
jgi:F0F1-type ATP synthase membrane subunit c/vacuolar-type H+-ATPase subunit K